MKFNNYYNKKIGYIVDTLIHCNKSQLNIESFENIKFTQSSILNIDTNKKKNEQLYLQNIIKNVQNKKKLLLSKDNKICIKNNNTSDNVKKTLDKLNNKNNSNILNETISINENESKKDSIELNTDVKYKNDNSSNIQYNNNKKDSIELNTDVEYKNDNSSNVQYNDNKKNKSNLSIKEKKINFGKNQYDCFSYIDINLDIGIFNNYQNILVVSNEPILYCCCIILYKKFLYLTDNKRNQFIKELKYIMAIDLDKKNLYNQLKYNHKRFKKTEFQDSLINNKTMNNEYFYAYIGDYFNVNIVLRDNNIINYLNNYNENRYSILLIKKDQYFYVHFNCENTSLIDHELCLKHNILTNIKKTGKNTLANLKISDLQNIAKGKNIEIKKQGKTGLINKSKKELLEEINR